MITEKLLRLALVGSSWVLYLLLALSVASISVMVERLLYFRRLRADLGALKNRAIEGILNGREADVIEMLSRSPSVEARVVAAGLAYRTGGPVAVGEAIDGELDDRKPYLERGMGMLGTLGNNAPFIGLFGTVLGVVSAFHNLADTQNKAAMGNVMAAIAEALVATGVGLFVALPAVIAFNVLQQKVSAIEVNVASFRKLVVAALHARERTVAARRSTAAPSIEAYEIPESAIGYTNGATPHVAEARG